MMLPEGENVLLLNEDQIQDLREARNKTRVPQSLSALAIQSVAEHFTRFIDVPDCPLKYLPNTIVQQLLSKIHLDIKMDEMLMPVPLLMQLLGLLVNPNVTELDCTVFDSTYDDAILNNYLLKHALENCPNIRDITVKNDPDKDHHQGHDVLPLESFKKSWNNLTIITMYGRDDSFDECAMEFLQENFPNIEELYVSVCITYSSKTVVNHFVNMKRLHTLYLPEVFGDEYLYNEYDSKMIEFFADVAGGVPNLRYFCFDVHVEKMFNTSEFIDLFGEEYPCKKLLMEDLRIEEGLKRKWPKNLSVRHLKINVSCWSDTEIENLSTIECTLNLTVDCKLAQQTYKVLDCIGGLVKRLTIKEIPKDTEIILERILAACPNLKHFTFLYRGSVVQDPEYNMLPAAFKNYKSFKIYESRYPPVQSLEEALQQVYRKFLIGTELCESLEYLNYEQLETLAQVALAYPESLQQLRKLHIMRTYNEEINDEKCEKYCEYFYQLIMRCHKLERIIFPVHIVARVNRYLATIQSIDPHFIH